MQKNIKKGSGKLGSTICAVVVVAVMLGIVVSLIAFLRLVDGEGGLFVSVFFALYIIADVAVAIGVSVALFLRFREMKRGEEEEAKKY